MSKATIELVARDVKGITEFLPKHLRPQHLYIKHTKSTGEEFVIRGGPKFNNMLIDDLYVDYSLYTAFHSDYDRDNNGDHRKTLVASGSDQDIDVYIAKMLRHATQINDAKYDYKLPILWAQNCNTVARHLIESAGLTFTLPTLKNGQKVMAPGHDANMMTTPFDALSNELLSSIENRFSFVANSYDSFIHQLSTSDLLYLFQAENCQEQAHYSCSDDKITVSAPGLSKHKGSIITIGNPRDNNIKAKCSRHTISANIFVENVNNLAVAKICKLAFDDHAQVKINGKVIYNSHDGGKLEITADNKVDPGTGYLAECELYQIGRKYEIDIIHELRNGNNLIEMDFVVGGYGEGWMEIEIIDKDKCRTWKQSFMHQCQNHNTIQK